MSMDRYGQYGMYEMLNNTSGEFVEFINATLVRFVCTHHDAVAPTLTAASCIPLWPTFVTWTAAMWSSFVWTSPYQAAETAETAGTYGPPFMQPIITIHSLCFFLEIRTSCGNFQLS